MDRCPFSWRDLAGHAAAYFYFGWMWFPFYPIRRTIEKPPSIMCIAKTRYNTRIKTIGKLQAK